MAQNAASGRSRRDALRLVVAAAPALLMAAAWPRVAGAATNTAQPLKIGMIGSGRQGGALGSLWVKAGHPVMFSSRNPEELKDLVAGLGPLARAGTVAQAIAFGDVVVIVVPYPAMREIGHDYAAALAKKALVIDVSNPNARRDGDAIVDWVNQQGGAGLATAKLLPGAHLVRGFNAIGYMLLSKDAHHAGGEIGIPIAGDDPKAIAIASTLIRQIGYEPVLIGGLAKGKYLVPGTPLRGAHTPAEIRQIAAGLG
ncbi:MAG: NADPH-dependent F420 reductase [Stellaceae bacterium]